MAKVFFCGARSREEGGGGGRVEEAEYRAGRASWVHAPAVTHPAAGAAGPPSFLPLVPAADVSSCPLPPSQDSLLFQYKAFFSFLPSLQAKKKGALFLRRIYGIFHAGALFDLFRWLLHRKKDPESK